MGFDGDKINLIKFKKVISAASTKAAGEMFEINFLLSKIDQLILS